MRKRAILHIGTHKTGSTSIQKALFTFAEDLDRQGVNYPVELTNHKIDFFGQHAVAWNLMGRKSGPFGTSSQEIEEALFKLSRIPHDKDLILSSEDFCLLGTDAIQTLKEYLEVFDTFVLMYFRRQDEAVQALYQTDVVFLGQTDSIKDWYNKRKNLFDYCAIADRWAEIFGQRIIVKVYERDKFIDKNVVVDFFEFVENIFDRKFTFPSWNNLDLLNLNKSLPDSITRIIQYYNNQSSKNYVVPVLRKLGSRLMTSRCSRFELLSPSERRSLLNEYEESNHILYNKYCGETKEMPLSTKIEQTDEEWKRKYNRHGHDIVELANDCLATIENIRTSESQ